MDDPFALSLILIIVLAVVGTFLRRRSRDKCLRSFANDRITLEEVGGKSIWGRLRVEITGLELVYEEPHRNPEGHEETSYILYKQEYPTVQAMVRYLDELDARGREDRDKELETAYHPTFWRRSWRRLANFFNTLRDSIMEAANLAIGRAGKGGGVGASVASQDKYVTQLKDDLMSSVGTAYEPLLERHIGKRVIAEVIRGDRVIEYPGVLRDYTADFISVMDVDYFRNEGDEARKADLVVPRRVCIVRHLGE